MSAFETYIQDLQEIRATKAGTKEISYYGALDKLLNELGKTLKPKVRCVMQLKNIGGAGMPDGGLFTASQFQRKAADAPTNPERGVLRSILRSSMQRQACTWSSLHQIHHSQCRAGFLRLALVHAVCRKGFLHVQWRQRTA